MATSERDLAQELAGLDALDEDLGRPPGRAQRAWFAVWPKLAAVAIALALWQAVVWSGWKPEYVLPSPATVAAELGRLITTATFWEAIGTTVRRALWGYAIALVVGTVLGIAVARSRVLRSAIGSLITGLQTMPSITWFPLAILLFQLTEHAITFVVVLGAAPSIANGIVAGVDHVPPLYLRAGRMLGTRGYHLYRHVVLPAALPSCVSGLKQGWAFAWRSLMAGELLVLIPGVASIGARLQGARDLSDAPALLAYMVVVLCLGIIVDSLFSAADRRMRARRGLIDTAR